MRSSVKRAPLRKLSEQLATIPLPAGALSRLCEDAMPEQRLELVAAAVEAHLHHVLGSAVGTISADSPFVDLGVDSPAAIELIEKLGEAMSVDLPPTCVFDYPNPGSLAAYLLEEWSLSVEK